MIDMNVMEAKVKSIFKENGIDLDNDKCKAKANVEAIIACFKYFKENAVITSTLPIPQGGNVTDGKIS